MNKKIEYFDCRPAALGTKHRKEVVISPLFKKELGLEVIVLRHK